MKIQALNFPCRSFVFVAAPLVLCFPLPFRYLLFSDSRGNKIWKWQDYTQSVFLNKSGCTTEVARCDGVKEPGKQVRRVV